MTGSDDENSPKALDDDEGSPRPHTSKQAYNKSRPAGSVTQLCPSLSPLPMPQVSEEEGPQTEDSEYSASSESELSDVTPEELSNLIDKPFHKPWMRQVSLSEDLKLRSIATAKSLRADDWYDQETQTLFNLAEFDGEERTNLFRAAKTPLEIPYLLNRIFNYLPLQDLKSCRLVSKEWRSSSLPQLRNYRLNITSEERLLCLVNYQGLWDYNDDPGTFCNFELPNDVPLSNHHMLLFFEIYGPYVKALVIPNNGWGAKDLQDILFNKLPVLEELKLIGDVPIDSDVRLVDGLEESQKLTKLKRLFLHFTNAQERALPMIHAHGFFNSGTNGWTKRLVIDLLSVAPNLEVVRCSNKRDMMTNPALCHKIAKQVNRQPDEVATSFSCVNQFLAQKLFSRQHNCTPKLVNLDLYLRLNDRGMEKLELKQYPLEALDLHVRYFDKESLVSLLRSLGKTLKFLRLRVDRQLILDFSFDFFIELETFHLEDYAENLLFLGDMPKLKTLVLDKFDGRKFTRKECPPVLINSKITELTLDTMRPIEMQGNCIKKLSILLPNIRSFTLKQARDSDLLRVFDSMPFLEHLKLISSEKGAITNCGLSGYTDADAERILDVGYEFAKYPEYEELRRLPYIGDLTQLKTLSLEGDLRGLTLEFMNQRMISNMHGLWILHGVGNLENLRSLSIQKAKMSSMELKHLVTQMNLFRLELHNCDFDPRMERWIRDQIFAKPFEFVLRKCEH